MAEDNLKPVEPPKVNPLAKPAVPHGTTIRLKPVIRTGMTQTTIRTGLKLPPRPATIATKPLARPAAAEAAPAPAASAPATAPAADSPSSTKSLDQLKGMTASLKSITSPIPQQAILHKTGIIADPSMTAAQIAAAKARTSRISLADAMGAAPVKNENAPMKTIRIKRPIDIPGSTTNFPHPQELVPESPAAQPAAAAPAPAAAEPASAPENSVTQRKTLKVARPGAAIRPSGKFGIKKKPAVAPSAPSAPAAPAAEAPAGEAEVADIPDIPAPSAAPAPVAAPPADVEKDVPKAVAVLGLIVQLAASVVIGLLAFKLYTDTTILPF